jgi:hypothetical protein
VTPPGSPAPAATPAGKAARIRDLMERYAIKFELDAPGEEPSDRALACVLGRCVRPARPAEYGLIRQLVGEYREGKQQWCRR